MIQINLSEKEARHFYNFAMSVMGVQDCPSAKAIISAIEHQLLPVSTNQAEMAVWRSKSVNPSIIEAWKRKHESAESAFGGGK